jgi:hypothetical protein
LVKADLGLGELAHDFLDERLVLGECVGQGFASDMNPSTSEGIALSSSASHTQSC